MKEGALRPDVLSFWESRADHGDLACMLSHLMLWRQIRSEGKPGTHLVFEDDADIRPDFLDRLRECLPLLPGDFHYAYVGHNDAVGRRINKFWLEPANTLQITSTPFYIVAC